MLLQLLVEQQKAWALALEAYLTHLLVVQEGGLMAKLMAMLFEAANKPEMESVLHAVFPRLLQRSLKLLCDAEVSVTALSLMEGHTQLPSDVDHRIFA